MCPTYPALLGKSKTKSQSHPSYYKLQPLLYHLWDIVQYINTNIKPAQHWLRPDRSLPFINAESQKLCPSDFKNQSMVACYPSIRQKALSVFQRCISIFYFFILFRLALKRNILVMKLKLLRWQQLSGG